MIELQPGSGFYYESESQYLIEFSESKYDWACLNSRHTLVIPPFDHELHDDILRHEKQHYKTFLFWIQNKFLLFIYLLLFNDYVFGGFDEFYVSYKSQTLLLSFKAFSNYVYFCVSVFWLIGLFLSFIQYPIIFILLIVFVFVIYFHTIHYYVDWSVIK